MLLVLSMTLLLDLIAGEPLLAGAAAVAEIPAAGEHLRVQKPGVINHDNNNVILNEANILAG